MTSSEIKNIEGNISDMKAPEAGYRASAEAADKELKALYKDGFFIKCAKETPAPTVIKKKRINDLFGILKEGGKAALLQPDGTVKEAYIFKTN